MSSWSRRSFLRSVGASGVVGGAGLTAARRAGATGEGPTKANIIQIYMDQWRGDVVGAFGHPIVQTPNADRLAAAGVSFPRCFTNGPLCRPARACMMTGRHIHENGIWSNNHYPDKGGVSHVRRMRDEGGYHTAVLGKTHLMPPGTDYTSQRFLSDMAEWGFDYAMELPSQPVIASSKNFFRSWVDATTEATAPQLKTERYDDYVDSFDHRGFVPPDEAPYRLGEDDHPDRWLALRARDYILDYSDPRPFYLQVNFIGPHHPFDAGSRHRELYDLADMDIALLGPHPSMSSIAEFMWEAKTLQGLTPLESKKMRRMYYATCSLLDELMGIVLDAVVEAGLEGDTWIIFTADHGEMLGDYEMYGKVVFFEGSLRIPLIIQPPGGTTPWTMPGLVDTVDVTKTILAIGGVPDDPADPGRSLAEQILDGPSAPGALLGKSSVIAAVSADRDTATVRGQMIRTEEYKLVFDHCRQAVAELYDLVADPVERDNLAYDPAYASTIEALLADLDAQSDGLVTATLAGEHPDEVPSPGACVVTDTGGDTGLVDTGLADSGVADTGLP